MPLLFVSITGINTMQQQLRAVLCRCITRARYLLPVAVVVAVVILAPSSFRTACRHVVNHHKIGLPVQG